MGFIDYLRDVRGELRHVSWPTRSQALNYTIIVLGLSIFIGLFLGLLDYLLTMGLQQLLNR